MTNSKTLQWALLAIAAILSISIYSCSKNNDDPCCDPTNPECPNYDPCYGVEEPNADFFIEDRVFDELTNEWFFYPEESGPIVGSNTRFRAKSQDDEFSHTWYIGADNYYDPMVEIDFSDVTRPANITVSHVIEYPVDSTCFPLSSGRDSVARTFQLIQYWNELLTVGNTFRGVLNNQTDSFDFKIRALKPDGSEAVYPTDFNEEYQFFRINMYNEGDSVPLGSSWKSNHFLSFSQLNKQGNLEINQETHSVRMEYQWSSSEDYVFTGRIVD